MCQIQAGEEGYHWAAAAPTGCATCVWLKETVAVVPASRVYIFIASVVQITNSENQSEEVLVVCTWLDSPSPSGGAIVEN